MIFLNLYFNHAPLSCFLCLLAFCRSIFYTHINHIPLSGLLTCFWLFFEGGLSLLLGSVWKRLCIVRDIESRGEYNLKVVNADGLWVGGKFCLCFDWVFLSLFAMSCLPNRWDFPEFITLEERFVIFFTLKLLLLRNIAVFIIFIKYWIQKLDGTLLWWIIFTANWRWLFWDSEGWLWELLFLPELLP